MSRTNFKNQRTKNDIMAPQEKCFSITTSDVIHNVSLLQEAVKDGLLIFMTENLIIIGFFATAIGGRFAFCSFQGTYLQKVRLQILK